MDTKVANALLGAVTTAALASELASQDASISGLQASKADASALTAYALQSAVDTSLEVDSKIAAALLNAVIMAALDAALLGKADASALASLLSTVDGLDTPLEVDTKIANALLGLATEACVAAQLASRDASITALQASKADTALLASYATNAALSASETALQTGAALGAVSHVITNYEAVSDYVGHWLHRAQCPTLLTGKIGQIKLSHIRKKTLVRAWCGPGAP